MLVHGGHQARPYPEQHCSRYLGYHRLMRMHIRWLKQVCKKRHIVNWKFITWKTMRNLQIESLFGYMIIDNMPQLSIISTLSVKLFLTSPKLRLCINTGGSLVCTEMEKKCLCVRRLNIDKRLISEWRLKADINLWYRIWQYRQDAQDVQPK